MDSLPQQLRTIREAKDMTQRRLAEAVGRAQAQISDVENGRIDPRLSNITQMVRALDHELILVPRQALPAVKGLLSGKSEKPLWSIEENEGDSTK
jgi:HTH-type transcriptional regulator/antitoxin HipB